MGQMQKTIDAQNRKINTLEKGSVNSIVPSSAVYGDEDFAKQLNAHLGDASKWLQGLKFSGDFRLRYEARNEQHNSSTDDRNRFRYRLRFGFTKKFSDELKVGFRLVSGDLGGITSTNQTMDSNFGFKDINVDRAYATYTPNWAEVGPIKGFEITAGKFKNPFTEGSSWIIWDSDVTPEGIYEKIDIELVRNDNIEIKMPVVLGQFILEEGGGSNHDDAELMAYQTGFVTKIKGVTEKPLKLTNLISYYDYKDFTLSGNYQATGGNPTGLGGESGTLAAQDFDIFETYNELAFQVKPLPKSKVFFDFAKNLNAGGWDSTRPDQDKAWAAGLKIGKAKKKGTWELGYTYAWIEQNAVPGVFSDSDFGQAGRRGSVLKGAYALTDNLKLGAAAFFTNRILSGSETSIADTERDLFQVDLAWKF